MSRKGKRRLLLRNKALLFIVIGLLFTTLPACDGGQSVEKKEPVKTEQVSSRPVSKLPPDHPAKEESVDVLLDGLLSRLQAEPDDVEGWVLLAKSYQYLGRSSESKEAFVTAQKLGYTGADITDAGNVTPIPAQHKEGKQSSIFSQQPVYQLMEEVLTEKTPPRDP